MADDLDALPWKELLGRLRRDVERRNDRMRIDAPERADEDAWAQFLRRLAMYGANVRRWYPNISAVEMDDWVQDLAVRYTDLSSLDELAKVRVHSSFLVQVLKHKMLDSMRRESRRLQQTFEVEERLYRRSEEADDPSEDLAADQLSLEAESRIRKLIEDLSKSDQLLIRLRIVENHSLREISKRLRTPYGTIASRWFRLMRFLENELT